MITREPSNQNLREDALLVAKYIKAGLSPEDGQMLAMLFHDDDYRRAVYELAAALQDDPRAADSPK